jgi:inhibitor of KinA
MKTRNRNRGYDLHFPTCVPAGDSAVLVYLGDRQDVAINQQVHALARALWLNPIEGFIETVPGYSSLLVVFDPLQLEFKMIQDWVITNLKAAHASLEIPQNPVCIPVVYGGKFGPDLEFVAAHNHLTVQEVITTHASAAYPVHFLGFLPGFPYLGGMDPAIAAPRLETPRPHIRAGSVGIAGGQTGIYLRADGASSAGPR